MLWIDSITRSDHVQYSVASIVKKLREKSYGRYGHVICVDDNSLAKADLTIHNNKERPKGELKRPNLSWNLRPEEVTNLI